MRSFGIAAVGLWTLAACLHAAAAPLEREPVHLAVWFAQDPKELAPVADIIRAAQLSARPRILVTLRPYPLSNAYRQMQEWCVPEVRGAPDVVIVADTWLPRFASSLQPLNALLPARCLAAYPESVKQRLRHAGNLYGVPWHVDAWALMYRPDVLEACGTLPPRTWEELVVAARRAHDPPAIYGFGLPGIRDGGAAELLLQMLWAEGVTPSGAERTGEMDGAKLTAALDLYARLHTVAEPEVLSWDTQALEEAFAQGRLAMMVAPRSLERWLRSEAPQLRYATAPLPAGSAGGGQVAVDLACIMKTSAHVGGAVAFLESLTTPKACRTLVELGSVPFRTDILSDYLTDPQWAAYVKSLPGARGLPTEGWEVQSAALSEGLLQLLTGRKTAAEASELIRTKLGERLTPAGE